MPLPILRTAALICLMPLAAHAQGRHWVQVEAHPTLRTAEEMARRYEADFGTVAGFRLPSGWYALALGPYASAQDAADVRLRLLMDRRIPQDAYLAQDGDYRQQFWPLGAQMPAPPAAVDESGLRIVEIDPPRRAEPVEPPAPVTAEQSALAHPGEERIDPPAPVLAEPARPREERIEPPAPVLAEPTAPREESVAEARAADSRLTRDERIEIQTALQFLGHYAMALDAAFGPGTRNAIGAWQAAQGQEATGFLTARQRAALVDRHAAEVARLGFDNWRDDQAGIEVTLPLGLVAYDRHESPFVHFEEAGNSGMRVLLISQDGTQAALAGLYDVMQTLEAVPLEGERSLRSDGFTITGESAEMRAHAEVSLQGGKIKGFALLWERDADGDAERILRTLQQSFRSIGDPLPGGLGAPPSTVARQDLLVGLEVRRPLRSRSGFFVNATGSVATTAEAVEGCGRVTIDSAHRARVTHLDEAAGLAILTPAEPLVPIAYAQFSASGARLNADVRVSGYSFPDTLSRPVLTLGRIAELQGLNGETKLARLAINVAEGDSGGPVFDTHGAVVGMLLPRLDGPARVLPEEVNFALSSGAVLEALAAAGLPGALSPENGSVPAEALTRVSADLTVLVSCWP